MICGFLPGHDTPGLKLKTILIQCVAEVSNRVLCSRIRPHDSLGQWLPGTTAPRDSGFTLIRDPYNRLSTLPNDPNRPQTYL